MIPGKPIVVGEHTLAFLYFAQPWWAQKLRASILCGATGCCPADGMGTSPVAVDGSDYRDATPQDFEDYRVLCAEHYFTQPCTPNE